MKRFIIISILVVFFAVHLMSQQKDHQQFSRDSIPLSLPPFEIERIDTLRFNPGDTIPTPMWKNYLKKKGKTSGKTLKAPPDNMPVIVPPDHQFYMIVVEPDTTYHYYIRNLGKKSMKSQSPEKLAVPGRKFKQNP
jgi:hypothetical protein